MQGEATALRGKDGDLGPGRARENLLRHQAPKSLIHDLSCAQTACVGSWLDKIIPFQISSRGVTPDSCFEHSNVNVNVHCHDLVKCRPMWYTMMHAGLFSTCTCEAQCLEF